MKKAKPPAEGLRERKRRQTRDRIAAVALDLFLDLGYDGTTIEMIAEQTDISARTVFHYYSSKERILEAIAGGGEAAFREALIHTDGDGPLLDAVREIMMGVISVYEAEKAMAISQLLYSTERLLAFKQAAYYRKERQLFQVLREFRPEEESDLTLRMAALAGIGALRVSSEFWVRDGRSRPLRDYLDATFDILAKRGDGGTTKMRMPAGRLAKRPGETDVRAP